MNETLISKSSSGPPCSWCSTPIWATDIVLYALVKLKELFVKP